MNIDTLAAALEAAKIAEARARDARIEAEEALLAVLPTKDEGSATEHGVEYKVTARYGVNRTIDAPALEAVRAQVPAALFDQAFEYAPKIKLAGLRYLRSNEPDTYRVLAQAITAKPAKPSVALERVAAPAALEEAA